MDGLIKFNTKMKRIPKSLLNRAFDCPPRVWIDFRPIGQCYQGPARIPVAKIEWPSAEQLHIKMKICTQNKHQDARMPMAKFFPWMSACWHPNKIASERETGRDWNSQGSENASLDQWVTSEQLLAQKAL